MSAVSEKKVVVVSFQHIGMLVLLVAIIHDSVGNNFGILVDLLTYAQTKLGTPY